MLAIFVERDDLHRDMAGQRVLLELAQHRPAEHVGQEDIERDRGRLELLGQLQRVDATRRDQHLEATVAREVHDAVHNADRPRRPAGASPGYDVETIVGDLLDHPIRRARKFAAFSASAAAGRDARADRRAGIFQRQIQREGAALAGRTAQLDLAAEQIRQLTADGKAEAGAAILAAGARVGLLECLEDDAAASPAECRCRCRRPRRRLPRTLIQQRVIG